MKAKRDSNDAPEEAGVNGVIPWLLASKSNEPFIRYTRITLVVFAVAASVAAVASGRVVFFGFLVLGMGFCVGFATLVLRSKSGAPRNVGLVIGTLMMSGLVIVFLAAVSYIVSGWPAPMSRWFGEATSTMSQVKLVYFGDDKVAAGPFEIAVKPGQLASEVAAQIREKLPPEIDARIAASARLFDVSAGRYLRDNEPINFSVGPFGWLLSNSIQPSVILDRLRALEERTQQGQVRVSTPPALVPLPAIVAQAPRSPREAGPPERTETPKSGAGGSSAEWQIHAQWCVSDRGSSGAAYRATCSSADQYSAVLACQSHNERARQAIYSAGRSAVNSYMRSLQVSGCMPPRDYFLTTRYVCQDAKGLIWHCVVKDRVEPPLCAPNSITALTRTMGDKNPCELCEETRGMKYQNEGVSSESDCPKG